jgi:hypothetical protein
MALACARFGWLAAAVVATASGAQAAQTVQPPPPPKQAPSTAKAARFDGTWNLKTPPNIRYALNPPYRPEAKAKFDAERPQDDPGSRCTESGLPRLMITVYPMQLVALKDHILLVNEFNHVVRRVWTDKTARDPDHAANFYGDGIVHWEGDVMVVDTVGLSAKNYLDPAGDLYGPKMHMVERWSLLTPNRLAIEFTFDDPETYTQPWKSTLTYDRVDWKLGEFSCTENNRNNPDDPKNDPAFTSTKAPAAYGTPQPKAVSGPNGSQN